GAESSSGSGERRRSPLRGANRPVRRDRGHAVRNVTQTAHEQRRLLPNWSNSPELASGCRPAAPRVTAGRRVALWHPSPAMSGPQTGAAHAGSLQNSICLGGGECVTASFGSIPHAELLKSATRRIVDRRVL